MPEILHRIAAAALSPLEDPTGLDRPLWRDYARYQYPIDPAQAVLNGVQGAAFRAGISWGYEDPFFKTYWKQWEGYNMYRTSYHVLYPDQPVIKQADKWYSIHPELDIIPRVIDLELQHGVAWDKIADVTWKMSEIVKSRDGHRPWIYSRWLLVRDWLRSWTTDMINEHYWWLAQYLYYGYVEHPGPPTRDPRMKESQVILHQTSDHKRSHNGEVGSGAVDWDRWELGTEDNMHELIRKNWGEGSGPPTPPPPSDKVVVVTASALNMRSTPDSSVNDNIIGSLRNGAEITVTEQSGPWLKVKEIHDAWVHGSYVQEK